MCAACGHQASVIAGTIFQGTRIPLSVWFRAIWWVVSQKNGASALGLQRVLGLGSYRTAWTWLHKLRRAMVRPGRDRVSERSRSRWRRGRRHLGKKALVVIAAAGPGGSGCSGWPTADSLLTFVQHAVQPGSVVITDGLVPPPKRGYCGPKAVLPRSTGLRRSSRLAPGYRAAYREHLDITSTGFNRRTSRSREAAPGTGRGGGSRSLHGQGYPWSEEETPPQPVVGT